MRAARVAIIAVALAIGAVGCCSGPTYPPDSICTTYADGSYACIDRVPVVVTAPGSEP